MNQERNRNGTNVPNQKIEGTRRLMRDGKTPDQIGESICTDLTKAWETFVEHVQRTLPRYEWLRKYFTHKPRLQRVCDCLTWQDYCENKLGKTARASTTL